MSGVAFACSVGMIVVLFFSPFAVFKNNLISWSWAPAMNKYGYGVCFCNSIYAVANFYSEPENYDVEAIVCEEADVVSIGKQKELPDIILILNESLADLNVYLDMEDSKEIFSKMNGVEGIRSGYTVSSLVGGGTNNSEFELLTSNSMQVLTLSAPFVSLNMRESTSVVSYLNDLGYTTAGMHCGNASNYNRNKAYADMGFDLVRLGRNEFTYAESGNRPWLDSDNYKDMIALYEACGDDPRFMYLLTYQNHGGYEQNDASDDTVAIDGDYGEYTDDINEYLTSVDKSINAFVDLIEYFENSNRKVVVMMLGDHAPAFLSDIPSNRELTAGQQDIAKRSIPYYIWSNRQIDDAVLPTYASMVDLVPLMLKSAGMPLTGYYKTIVELNQKVPIRTSTGLYMGADGEIASNVPGTPYYDIIQNYYYLEYNNLTRSDDYRPKWFELDIK